MRKIPIYFLIIFFILFLGMVAAWARTESPNYIIWADVFSAGGTEDASSANYGIQDTIGEAVIWSATTKASNYGIKSGFRELYPDQYLSFSAGATTVNLGTLSVAAAKTASHTLTIDTNATKGFTIKATGATLTSGANTITAIGATAVASTVGTEQFGLNLVANTSPSIGADPSGTVPIGSAAGAYATANQFAFNSGDTVASASNDINSTVFTVSYLANMASGTEGGNYATTLTYAATANF